jgi:hypothetical protein
MAKSLLDIAPAAETIAVAGSEVAVHGISVKGIAVLLARFPELRTLMGGGEVDAELAGKLMAIAPDAVAAIIAGGTGMPGSAEAEERAALLSIDAQLDLISAVLRLTFPRGVGPFVERLTALGGSLNVSPAPAESAAPAEAPASS